MAFYPNPSQEDTSTMEDISPDHILYSSTRQFPNELVQIRILNHRAKRLVHELLTAIDEWERVLPGIYDDACLANRHTSSQRSSRRPAKKTEAWRTSHGHARRLRSVLCRLSHELNVVSRHLAEAGERVLPGYMFHECCWGSEMASMARGPDMIAALFPRTFQGVGMAMARLRRVTPAIIAAGRRDFVAFQGALVRDGWLPVHAGFGGPRLLS
ncbi:hypothetical protein MAPG_08436 [Magnaporthiopsis poae ATCC 64411]|uniref:Uncharacterized protein n=1 Tax=Magnaporthiopsis poae (strain ATCC 64411 / 73-15) TaxID=644358 RepID=A0A0C4E7C4_MAGP6|nr:hypothetical protein MAPG_08436 [Magnaporthiopsis poae ATCC 64411]